MSIELIVGILEIILIATTPLVFAGIGELVTEEYYEKELYSIGANIIIYANQLLRSAYPSMLNCANTILKNQRSYEADSSMMSIKDILNLIPGTNVQS